VNYTLFLYITAITLVLEKAHLLFVNSSPVRFPQLYNDSVILVMGTLLNEAYRQAYSLGDCHRKKVTVTEGSHSGTKYN